MDDEREAIEFEEAEIEENYSGFSIDDELELRFNQLQSSIEQNKILYTAYIHARKEVLRWLDQD